MTSEMYSKVECECLGRMISEEIANEVKTFRALMGAEAEVIYIDAHSYEIGQKWLRSITQRVPDDKFMGIDIQVLPTFTFTIMASFKDNDATKSVTYIRTEVEDYGKVIKRHPLMEDSTRDRRKRQCLSERVGVSTVRTANRTDLTEPARQ